MSAIPMGKTRPIEKPYLTVTDGRFTFKVLKAYSADPDKPYARWLCEVTSPYTGPIGDIGDTYISDVAGVITQRDPDVPDEAMPSHLRKGGTKSRRQLEAEWDLLI